MENNQPQIVVSVKRHSLGERILIIAFAGLSLAFALYYTLANATTHAGSPETIAASKPITIDASAASPATVGDVVAKAQAFKATLTAAQTTTLQQNYSAMLARRWSNLPCGSSCRNGIQFSNLTSAQLAAALAVIQAALGSAANEGYDEFHQIRLSDDILGANGGGGAYNSGIYFIAFLNEPSTTGGWMLQFGGHHYAANIAYNNGRVVGATPQFRGIEPVSFPLNGATVAPLSQERDALATMLASLTSAQLTTARLTQTFGDVTMSPGETNGGNGTFPTTRVGIQVGSLSDAQKALVVAAIRPYTIDLDPAVAENLFRIYQNELNDAYIAYTGNGTAGNASSFLNANTNYVRIDGPSVWIEFSVRTAAVTPGAIHYHSVYRDRQRDYGRDLSLTVPLDVRRANFDFDGDNRADLAVFRPSNATWFVQQSSNNSLNGANFGLSSDTLVPGDYDADGRFDFAVFRGGTWYVQQSTAGFTGFQFGLSSDIPVPGDYDGDGKTDFAVFRPSNGIWYIQQSTAGFTAVNFGTNGDKPVPADYDGDGKTDVAVNRAGTWYIQRSQLGFFALNFGLTEDRSVQADYDGDGRADIAVFRLSNGTWYVQQSTAGFFAVQFGLGTDTPTPADYDGDGKADVAVFRNGTWYIN
ncbi:MAG TPA: DUF3500 domain-containing protein, partial [Pyrinomonadaceae bacterium]|nr:DUF3500 domain-containing protein [Pyrinomonadaceae bacterium]